MESVSAGRAFASKHGYKLDVRQELLGLGSANLLVAFGHGYPVAGDLSQSTVNEKAGAKTPLSLIFASATLALCLLFLTGFLRNLPKAALAAIVLMAVTGLIKVQELRHLWRVSKLVFTVAAVASILLLIHHVARPHVAFLGRIPEDSDLIASLQLDQRSLGYQQSAGNLSDFSALAFANCSRPERRAYLLPHFVKDVEFVITRRAKRFRKKKSVSGSE